MDLVTDQQDNIKNVFIVKKSKFKFVSFLQFAANRKRVVGCPMGKIHKKIGPKCYKTL
jgi:hypothetical protein